MGISFLLEKKDFFSYSKFKGKIDHFLCNIVCVCAFILEERQNSLEILKNGLTMSLNWELL